VSFKKYHSWLLDARFHLTFTTIKSVKSVQEHDGISKSSLTKSVTKTMRTFVTVYVVGPVLCHCWRHHRSWLFFVSCVQQSASIPEFQGCPGYNTLLTAISFLDIRRNHKGQNQVSKEQVTTALLLAAKIYCCFCSVVNNNGTSCAQAHCKCMCYWQVPCNKLNSAVISEMVLCQSSLTISGTLSSSSLTQPVEV